VLLAVGCSTVGPLTDVERAADPPPAIVAGVAALQPGAIAFIEGSERIRQSDHLTAQFRMNLADRSSRNVGDRQCCALLHAPAGVPGLAAGAALVASVVHWR